MNKLIVFVSLVILNFSAFAAEEHQFTASMVNRNHYVVQGKEITIVTQNCQEYSQDESVTLVIDGLNNTYLTFSNGNSCKVSDILNPNNQSFAD